MQSVKTIAKYMENKNFYDETGSNWTATDRDTYYDPTKITAEAIYVFLTPEDAPGYEIHRWIDGEGQKQFATIRYNTTGYGNRLEPEENWVWKHGKGDHPILLYRGKELRESDTEAPVWITEGEKDADLLISMGEVAVTNSHGAGNWQLAHSEQLEDRDCIICVDNDDRGRKRARWIARELETRAKSVSFVFFSDMPAKSDVSDFVEAGGTLEGLKKRVQNGFARDEKKGSRYPSQDNVSLALELMGVKVSYDEFKDRILIDGLAEFGPTLDDAGLIRLRLQMVKQCAVSVYKDPFLDIVADLARHNKFHPVRDYLDGLEWDGTPRLDSWLITYGGAEDNEYVQAVGTLTLIAAVRRIRQPGCKFDEMLVLESPQGKDKSSALSVLAKNEEWFSDDLPLNQDSKVVIERTAGHWIMEAAELKGIGQAGPDHLKAFLSRRVDKSRLAYGKLTREMPRQFIVIGTTNDTAYLEDSENRRIWPVKIKKFDLDLLKRDVDQIWAEAAAREAAGASIRLKEELWGKAAEEQKARQIEHPFADQLREVLGDNMTGRIKPIVVWDILDIPSDKRSTKNTEMGKAMRELGFERKKIRFNGNGYGYQRGEDTREIIYSCGKVAYAGEQVAF